MEIKTKGTAPIENISIKKGGHSLRFEKAAIVFILFIRVVKKKKKKLKNPTRDVVINL